MRRLPVTILFGSLAIACGPLAAGPGTPAVAAPADGVAPDAQATTAPVADPAAAGRAVPAAREVLAADRTEAYAALAATLARGADLAPFGGRFANWPVAGRISSPFGPRWGGFHTGLDIAAPMNAEVRAAAAGQVVIAGKPYLAYGDTATIVIIAHGDDLATLYAHLSDDRPPIVRVGQRVAAGEVIAYVGSSGWSTGPHVHFMTVLKGRAVDPIPYLP